MREQERKSEIAREKERVRERESERKSEIARIGGCEKDIQGKKEREKKRDIGRRKNPSKCKIERKRESEELFNSEREGLE